MGKRENPGLRRKQGREFHHHSNPNNNQGVCIRQLRVGYLAVKLFLGRDLDLFWVASIDVVRFQRQLDRLRHSYSKLVSLCTFCRLELSLVHKLLMFSCWFTFCNLSACPLASRTGARELFDGDSNTCKVAETVFVSNQVGKHFKALSSCAFASLEGTRVCTT